MEGISNQSVAQGYEMLGAALAKGQQQQEGKMTMQLLQSAVVETPTATPVGNLGNHIDVMA